MCLLFVSHLSIISQPLKISESTSSLCLRTGGNCVGILKPLEGKNSQGDTIQTERDLFVVPDGNGVEDLTTVAVGFRIASPTMDVVYQAKFIKSIDRFVAEFEFNTDTQSRVDVSRRLELMPQRVAMSDRLDAAILQAAADVYGTEIFHSLKVNPYNKRSRTLLTRKGYRSPHGHPEAYARVYKPQPQH